MSSESTIINTRAPAKLNLTFAISGVLPDGFHEVETIFQAVDLEDELTFCIQPAERLKVELTCTGDGSFNDFPLDDSNLIARAIKLFVAKLSAARAMHGIAPTVTESVSQQMHGTTEPSGQNHTQPTGADLPGGAGVPPAPRALANLRRINNPVGGAQTPSSLSVQVHVHKTIPIAAGLAGGSSNAAAALVALNHYFGAPFPMEALIEMAAALGSDVPFCVAGGTQSGRHKGDKLSPVVAPTKMFFAIIKPREISIATPWIYTQYDEYISRGKSPPTINLPAALEALASADLELAALSFANAFEPIVYDHYPELALLKDRVVELGAWGCYMTGSGPTLFALVADTEMAHFVRRRLLLDQTERLQPWSRSGQLTLDCWIAESLATGARIVESPPAAPAVKQKESV